MTPASNNDPVIKKLTSLKENFEKESGRFKGYADTVSEVINELQVVDVKNNHQNNVDAFLSGLAVLGKPLKNRNIIFLIDGSGSMAGAAGSPLKKALETAKIVHDAVKGMKDVSVSSLMWGGRQPVLLPLEASDVVDKYKAGMNSGTDLAPAISYVDKAINFVGAGKQDINIIIISDGDLSDRSESYDALKKLLMANSRVTADVALMQNRGFAQEMLGLVRDVAAAFLNKSIGTYEVAGTDLTGKMVELLIRRGQESVSRPKKFPKGGAPKA